MTINKTNIIFDDNLIYFYDKAQEALHFIYDDNMTEQDIMRIQQSYREYYDNYYDTLNFYNKNDNIKPNYFAISCLLCSDRETVLKKEWEVILDVNKNYMGAFESDFGEKTKMRKCCCSQNSGLFKIKFKKTGKFLFMGTICVRKTLIIQKGGDFENNLKNIEKRKREYRCCITCKKRNIKKIEPEWKKECLFCYLPKKLKCENRRKIYQTK
jgi:hypothetical protein